MPPPKFVGRVTAMKVLDYLDWVRDSRDRKELKPLALPPVQRSALWGPRQIVSLWDSLFEGMPVGSFHLSTPGADRREIGMGGQSRTTALGPDGFDLLDGQQRTHAMLLAIDPPQTVGKCLWVEVMGDGIKLHLTTRAHPFGFDAKNERFNVQERAAAWKKFASSDQRYENVAEHDIFDLLSSNGGRPPMPHRVKEADCTKPLCEVIAAWRARAGDTVYSGSGASADTIADLLAAMPLRDALHALRDAELAMIRVEPPERPGWLLDLFDRIGAGGTALSGPERLLSMYKYHVPPIHDAVDAISAAAGLLEPVEVARTAIRIAATKKNPPAFREPEPADFQHQVAPGGELRGHLDALIGQPQAAQSGALGRGFAVVADLLRYRSSATDGSWDVGLPSVLIAELHSELLRTLVYWAVLVEGRDVETARSDVVRFALFWHLCVTKNDKAAVNGVKALYEWHGAGPSDVFPWRRLLEALTGIATPIGSEASDEDADDGQDPSALRLIRPEVMAKLGYHSASSSLRTWEARFERGGKQGEELVFRRWWTHDGLLLWLQRDYINRMTPQRPHTRLYEAERVVDLDHIQPSNTYDRNRPTRIKRLPADAAIYNAFCNGRYIVGDSIGNHRWVHYTVNRSDGDKPIKEKLCLESENWTEDQEKRPGSRGGAMDVTSRETWQKASGTADDHWTEGRIMAWQQAVEERTVWLYRTFWESAGFDEWFPGTPQAR